MKKDAIRLKDEFAFIQSLLPKKQYHPSVIKGIGDDAALFHHGDEYDTVVCIDTLVENIHFKRCTMLPAHIGYKALAVNLSDIAAMGGIPNYYLVSIAVPKIGWKDCEVKKIFDGMNELAERFKVDLIGGDTVSSNQELVITVTAIGKVAKGRRLFRQNSKSGDVVFVTGFLGASAAGLSLLLEHGMNYPYAKEQRELIEQHQKPDPQIEAGLLLVNMGVRIALNDISDGIASEANELAEASGKTIVLDYGKIPKHPALGSFSNKEIEDFVLYGGEDFQLIGTANKKNWDQIQSAFQEANIQITEIGYVTGGEPKVHLLKNHSPFILGKRGYNHFRKNE